MATYLLIRGLTRDNVQTGSASMVSRSFRVPFALGKKYDSGVKANFSTSLTGANNDLKYTAKYGGTWANGVSVEYLDPSGNNKALTVSVVFSKTTPFAKVSVSLATDGAGAITSTAAQVAAAVAANATANSLVSVANAAANNGTGVVTAMSATGVGSGTAGTDVGTGDAFDIAVSARATVMVDLDDARTLKRLRRHNDRFVSLGLAT